MVIYLYCQKLQFAMMERIKSQISSIVVIENLYSIRECNFDKKPNHLIVISQPDEVTMKGLCSLEWDSISVFIGVRWDSSQNVDYFDDEKNVADHMKNINNKYLNTLKKVYVDKLYENTEISEDDVEYLESIDMTGIKKKPKLNLKFQTKVKLYWKGLIGVMGSSQWASTFAIEVAKQTKQSVLIVDGDLMAPSLDCHFGIDQIQTSIVSHVKGIDNTGLNIALDAIGKRVSLEYNIENMIHKVGNNTYVMLGNYNVYNYEHYEESQLKSLLIHLQKYFDIVIVNVSNSIYDSLSMLTMHLSHVNIMVLEDKAESIRYYRNIFEVMHLKQKIPRRKQILVKIQEKSNKVRFSDATMKAMFGPLYAGAISNRYWIFKSDSLTSAILKKMTMEKKKWG